MNALADQQEVMADLADIIIQVYALESALLRARKLKARKLPLAATAEAMVKVYAAKAMDIVELASRRIVAAVAEGDSLRVQLAICRRLAKRVPEDGYAQARAIASHLVEYGVWTS
jgi:butyryl-CoA dehydrogenase